MAAQQPDVNAEVERKPFEDKPIPTLMRGARGAYAQAIRAELRAIGVDDLPRNGAFVLFGSLSADNDPGPSLPTQIGISKQAVSQLVETLVQRGYLIRSGDPKDGRRVALSVTARGQEVVDAVVRAVDAVDEELAAAVSSSEMLAFRKTLSALSRIKAQRVLRGVSTRKVPRGTARFEPIFPVRDLAAALAHYENLGFKTHSFDDGYGFARRGGVSIHLSVRPDHQAADNTSAAYLQVPDADAVQAVWSKAGLGGVTRPVEGTPWGMREGSHTDPDGNLIRFGSPSNA